MDAIERLTGTISSFDVDGTMKIIVDLSSIEVNHERDVWSDIVKIAEQIGGVQGLSLLVQLEMLMIFDEWFSSH